MRILISGARGLIGSALSKALKEAGHVAVRLVRASSSPGASDVVWDPRAGRLDPAELEGFDAIVHLAGESIAARRWTKEQKTRIRDSRVAGTRLLAEAMAKLTHPPFVWASASAIGYYGNRGDEEVDEQSAPGTGFLAQVCRDWEAATEPAASAGIRVLKLRIGLILAEQGGTLTRLLPLFRWGLGGSLGNGRQYMSWITLDDVVDAITLLLANPTIAGPVNLVAPHPVTNREFTQALARVLRRPAMLPVPAFLLRAGLGEMADELLLSSARVSPRRLLQAGYRFRDALLPQALQRLLVRVT